MEAQSNAGWTVTHTTACCHHGPHIGGAETASNPRNLIRGSRSGVDRRLLVGSATNLDASARTDRAFSQTTTQPGCFEVGQPALNVNSARYLALQVVTGAAATLTAIT